MICMPLGLTSFWLPAHSALFGEAFPHARGEGFARGGGLLRRLWGGLRHMTIYTIVIVKVQHNTSIRYPDIHVS